MTILALTIPVHAKYVLVIDAGHGGHDAGAVGSYSYEKNINLATALAFGRYVEKNCPDVTVIYTRKTDVFIPLHQRADIANKNHADVFISIHTNSLPAGRIARGLETYTMGMRRSNEKLSAAQRENNVITYESDYKQRYAGYDPNSPESSIMFEFMNDRNMAKSVELAKLVQKNACATSGRPDKGVKQDVFLVLRETSMPACLIELGWISTPDEEVLLNNASYIDKIALGIYQAFVQYKNGGSVNVKVEENKPSSIQEEKDTRKQEIQQQKQEVQHPEQEAKQEIKQEPKREAKQEVKQQPKQEVKQQPKQEVKQQPKQEVKQQPKQEVKQQPKQEVKQKSKQETSDDSQPVFKVQILSYSKAIRPGDERFKGETPDSYIDGNLHKYTVGSSTDYNEIVRLKRQLAEKFPGAFIIAFKNGERIDVSQAVQESRANKKNTNKNR